MTAATPGVVDARRLHGARAGLVSRLLAAGVDLAATIVGVLVVYFTIAGAIFVLDPRRFSFPRTSTLHLFLLGELLLFLILFFGWSVTGRSFGKAVLGLRVVTSEGERLRPARAALRALVCIVFPVSLFFAVADRKNRALHDRLVGTVVVYDWLSHSLSDSHNPVGS